MCYFVYILKSEKDGRLYKGISKDPMKRWKEHNSGKTMSTKGYRPWKLVFSERLQSRMEARNREKYFKSGRGRAYLRNILDL